MRHGFCDRCGKFCHLPVFQVITCLACRYGARMTHHRDRDNTRTG